MQNAVWQDVFFSYLGRWFGVERVLDRICSPGAVEEYLIDIIRFFPFGNHSVSDGVYCCFLSYRTEGAESGRRMFCGEPGRIVRSDRNEVVDLCKRMYMNRLFRILCVSALVAATACGDDDPKKLGSYVEPEAERIVFTQSNLVYYGAEVSDNSDLWELILMTEDVTVDEMGFPVGPGCFMQLAFNTAPSDKLDTEKLAGDYRSASSSGDFSVGTFLWGDIARLELPTGVVEMPTNSFFCELAAGSSELDPDLLNEKGFTIVRNGDGSFDVHGTLVGTRFLQRNFTFRGELKAVDRSEEQVPQTTLTGDLKLDDEADFTQMRLECDKLSFGYAGINLFKVILAEEGVDLTDRYPHAGNGRMLQLDLLVDAAALAADGVPAGDYDLLRNAAGTTAFYRDDLVPFRARPGTPGQFSEPAGCWYRRFTDGQMTEYACVWGGYTGKDGVPDDQLKWNGRVTVRRDGGKHTFEVSLTDYSERPNRITGTFAMTDFEVYR